MSKNGRHIVGEKQHLVHGGDEGDATHEAYNPHLSQFLRDKEGDKQVLKPINIYQIWPDGMQPRRAIPSRVRLGWDGSPGSLPGMFGVWLALAEEEREGAHGLAAAMIAGAEVEVPDEIGAIEGALLAVIALAVSIQRDGLTNPITVVKAGESAYRIETGERRWLAYHLLAAQYGDDARWQKIAARVVDRRDVWRQASENNTRSELNAIGKARQFAILLMDLIGGQFAAFDDFAYEQDFYAQVADGETYRVPRGKGEALINAMGLKNDRQLRYYRALLRLPRDLWVAADDGNWPERRIRDVMEGDTGTVGPVSEPHPPAPSPTGEGENAKTFADVENGGDAAGNSHSAKGIAEVENGGGDPPPPPIAKGELKRYWDAARRMNNFFEGKLMASARDVLEDIARQRAFLDEVEKRLRG